MKRIRRTFRSQRCAEGRAQGSSSQNISLETWRLKEVVSYTNSIQTLYTLLLLLLADNDEGVSKFVEGETHLQNNDHTRVRYYLYENRLFTPVLNEWFLPSRRVQWLSRYLIIKHSHKVQRSLQKERAIEDGEAWWVYSSPWSIVAIRNVLISHSKFEMVFDLTHSTETGEDGRQLYSQKSIDIWRLADTLLQPGKGVYHHQPIVTMPISTLLKETPSMFRNYSTGVWTLTAVTLPYRPCSIFCTWWKSGFLLPNMLVGLG